MNKKLVLIGIILLFLPVVYATLSDNLISYWALNTISGNFVLDSIGTANGTAFHFNDSNWVTGISGNALKVNRSNQYVNIDNSTKLELIETDYNFSISFWIYPKSAHAPYGTIISKFEYAGSNNGWITYYGTDRRITFVKEDNDLCVAPCIFKSKSQIPLNKWTFVAINIKSNGNETIWIGDTLDNNSNGIANAIGSDNGGVVIGAVKEHVNRLYPFNGTIDEIRYWNRTITQTDIDNLSNFGFDVTYSNYKIHQGKNITRILNYTVRYLCTKNLYKVINGQATNINANCDNNTHILKGTYKHTSEGKYNITFELNSSSGRIILPNTTFISDLYNASIKTATIKQIKYFGHGYVNVTLTCQDNIIKNLTYNKTFNGYKYFKGANLTNKTNQWNRTKYIVNGLNNLTVSCNDGFGANTKTYMLNLYQKQITLIEEKNNTNFNLNNCSSAVLYLDKQQQSFNFKSNNSVNVNFTTINDTFLRLELKYIGDVYVNKFVDVSLTDTPLRLCANKEGTTFYQQVFVSATPMTVILKSLYSNCYATASYTSFATANYYTLKGYTTETMYALYSHRNGTMSLLANIDGSSNQNSINLDNLQYQNQLTGISLQPEIIAIQANGSKTVRIYYKNSNQDNSVINVQIQNMDDEEYYYNSSSFSNKNEFTINFGLAGITYTNTTLFKIIVYRENSLGKGVIYKYFNNMGKTKGLAAGLAFTIAILLTIFGLTFTASKLSLGWFGFFMVLAAVIVLTLAAGTWYINLFIGVEIIILVYIGIVMTTQNQGVFT